MGPGEPGSNDPHARGVLFKRVRGDPALRRICELAGRFRRVAQSKQRREGTHGLAGHANTVFRCNLFALPPSLIRTGLAEQYAAVRESAAVEQLERGAMKLLESL